MSENKEILKNMCCFGVAGNFTGHLEQAGEAESFKNVVTKTSDEPKAIFPTFIPSVSSRIPAFLNVFPFSSEKIMHVENLQIESECAVIFDVEWKDEKISSLKARYFAASNDCSIRRPGEVKISVKKNWGEATKGFSSNVIPIDDFSDSGNISKYRIKSFVIRDGKVFEYGEDSRISDYSYIYSRLTNWLVEKINSQKDVGSAEEILLYLKDAGFPKQIMISIGATRYTPFGLENFLEVGDESVVCLYPEDKYTPAEVETLVLKRDFSSGDISFLVQKVSAN